MEKLKRFDEFKHIVPLLYEYRQNYSQSKLQGSVQLPAQMREWYYYGRLNFSKTKLIAELKLQISSPFKSPFHKYCCRTKRPNTMYTS